MDPASRTDMEKMHGLYCGIANGFVPHVGVSATAPSADERLDAVPQAYLSIWLGTMATLMLHLILAG